MAGYTKLFSDIVDSSIWKEDSDTCKVWVTLLALSDQDGFIRGSVGWLADKAQVPNEICSIALGKFQKPDPRSRTPDNEGRRIEQLDDGWLILNYLTYRDRLSPNPVATRTRLRVQKHREKYRLLRNRQSVTSPVSASVSVYASESVPDCTVAVPVQDSARQAFSIDLFNDLKAKLIDFYKRTSPRLSGEDEHLLATVSQRLGVMDEFSELKAFRPKTQYFPRSMTSLLRDWDKTLDQSRNQPVPVKPKTLDDKIMEELKRL